MARITLTAYGQPSDQEKLDDLAKLTGKSASAVIVSLVREQHAKMFGTEFHRGTAQPQGANS